MEKSEDREIVHLYSYVASTFTLTEDRIKQLLKMNWVLYAMMFASIVLQFLFR